jgi:Zn-dependent peptidase ImmA (M78 family)
MMVTPKELYAALTPLGIKRAQLRSLLPDWWEDNLASTNDGAWEFVLLVARRLSLDATALAHGQVLRTGAVTSLAYKHSKAADAGQLTGSSLIAGSLAQAIVAAVDRPYRAPSPDPRRVHAKVRELGDGTADFDSLLSFCWESGIPVVPLPNLPVGMRKMDGAALMIGSRPVIIISRRNDSKSWLSFILGHELGHIALGHLSPDSSIIDVALHKESTYAVESSTDPQEAQADEFSLAVLGGSDAERAQADWSSREAAVNLAVAARERAASLGIAPGHLVLRYAFRTKRWPEAAVALRFLSEDFDAQSVVVSALALHLQLDNIADDLRDLIAKITGVGIE